MSPENSENQLEQQISQWRDYVRHRQAIHSVDIAELEDHLREQVGSLVATGLNTEEAFLVAVKRMGKLDELSREFAREHSDRLWKQLVVSGGDHPDSVYAAGKDALVAWSLAVAAALLVKAPVLFGLELEEHASFYVRNLGFFVLPLLTTYFIWKRQLAAGTVRNLGIAFVVAAVFANAYPFVPGGSTEVLSMLHLPIALWLLVGIAYAGGRWGEVAGRMDFVRFSGELFIYFVLIALGGGVLTGFMALIFQAIGIGIEPFFETWWLPCGAAGAVLVAAWLVEAKQSVIENMAPVLTRLFTPLFTAVLLAFLVTIAIGGRGVMVEREVLIVFDMLLVVVLGLLLYSVSARDNHAPPGWFDVVMVVLVVCALLADAVALWAIAARINEFGFSPNRVAALGENLVLLANLVWSAWLYIRFLRGQGSFAALERWQTGYLPVYAIWAAIVVILFPPLFNFL
jgi:hypothetical protein